MNSILELAHGFCADLETSPDRIGHGARSMPVNGRSV